MLATRKQLGLRKGLSFKFEPGCKICADHTLDVMAQVYQGGLNSANPKVANLLSDVSAFFDHVEIGLTREEVQATKDADAPADDSLSDRANKQAKVGRRAAATLATKQAEFQRAETFEVVNGALSKHFHQRCAASSPVR